jgi:hypothetical protein
LICVLANAFGVLEMIEARLSQCDDAAKVLEHARQFLEAHEAEWVHFRRAFQR